MLKGFLFIPVIILSPSVSDIHSSSQLDKQRRVQEERSETNPMDQYLQKTFLAITSRHRNVNFSVRSLLVQLNNCIKETPSLQLYSSPLLSRLAHSIKHPLSLEESRTTIALR